LGFGSLYTRKSGYFHPYFSLGLQMLISSLILLPYWCNWNWVNLMSIPAISWWSIAYLVIIGSILSFIAYIYMLQNLPAEINSIYAYINPIVVLLGA
jgi:drug/metabolite transporter (DMT)-like permease